jgi:hypothetical protein
MKDAPVVARSLDRVTSWTEGLPAGRAREAGRPRSAIPAGSGDPRRTGRRFQVVARSLDRVTSWTEGLPAGRARRPEDLGRRFRRGRRPAPNGELVLLYHDWGTGQRRLEIQLTVATQSPLFVDKVSGSGGARFRSVGNGSSSSNALNVTTVNVRPSVSRITGPKASAVLLQPIPPRTAIRGTPPRRWASIRSDRNRDALSRAVPPSFATLHSRIAFSADVRGSKITKSGAGLTVSPNWFAIAS